jgi:hypothetical protein
VYVFGPGTLRPGAPVRKPSLEGRLECVEPEAFPLQLGGHARRRTEAGDERLCPVGFRLERCDAGFGGVHRRPFRLEERTDRLVPVAPGRERLGPRRGEPQVVQVADALERVERVGPCVLVDAGLRKPVVDLAPRAIAVAECARRQVERVAVLT